MKCNALYTCQFDSNILVVIDIFTWKTTENNTELLQSYVTSQLTKYTLQTFDCWEILCTMPVFSTQVVVRRPSDPSKVYVAANSSGQRVAAGVGRQQVSDRPTIGGPLSRRRFAAYRTAVRSEMQFYNKLHFLSNDDFYRHKIRSSPCDTHRRHARLRAKFRRRTSRPFRWDSQQTLGKYTVWVKKSPEIFWHFSPNDWEFLVQILRAYCTFLSTLKYKFLFICNFDEVSPY